MPRFEQDVYVDIDIDVDDFLNECDSRDIKDLIESLVEDGHLPKSVLNSPNDKLGKLESDFVNKIDSLKNKYYSISQEDEEILNQIFKKYL
jgi:hypothetical protein